MRVCVCAREVTYMCVQFMCTNVSYTLSLLPYIALPPFLLSHLTHTHTDINECLMTPSPCDQVCENVPGSYVCECVEGYRRLDNGSCAGM